MPTDRIATLGQRALARVIDGLIIFTVLLALGPPNIRRVDGEVSLPPWVILTVVASFVLYETVLVATRGQTVGKLFTGVRVASVLDGSTPGIVQALLRSLVVAAPLAALGTWGPLGAVIVYLTAALDRGTGRGAPDRIAATVVVQSSDAD